MECTIVYTDYKGTLWNIITKSSDPILRPSTALCLVVDQSIHEDTAALVVPEPNDLLFLLMDLATLLWYRKGLGLGLRSRDLGFERSGCGCSRARTLHVDPISM